MTTRKILQLVRVVMETSPDGTSVKHSEALEVLAEWPTDKPREADGYFTPGDWRIVSVKPWNGHEKT